VRRSRLLLNTGYALLALHAIVMLRLGAGVSRTRVSDFVQLALGLVVVATCRQAWRRSTGFARQFWRLTAFSYCLWLPGQSLALYCDFVQDAKSAQWGSNLFFCFWFLPLALALFLDPDSEQNRLATILDVVQAALFYVTAYLFFVYFPRSESMTDLAKSVWTPYFIGYAFVAGTFLIRSRVAQSPSGRALFARAGVLLSISGLADAVNYYGLSNVQAGTSFDILWSVLLVIPLCMAASWDPERWPEARRSVESPGNRSIAGTQLFPLFYPLLAILMAAGIARSHLQIAAVVVVVSFVSSTARQLLINRQRHQSEKRYRSLFENMLHGFAYCRMLYDDQGQPVDFVYLDVNGAFATLTGLEDVVGRKVSEVIPKIRESSPELFEIYGRVAQTGRPEKFEIELKPLGVWCSVSAYSTQKDYFVAVFDNITERKRAEAALQEAEQRYRLIFEKNSIGISQSSVDGRFLSVNPAFARMLGYDSPEELIASVRPRQLYVDDDCRRELSGRLRVQGEFENCEFQAYRKDGGKLWVRGTASAVRAADGSILYYVGAADDITQRKTADQQVQFLAYYDALTGLPNRTLFQDRVGKALASARRRGEKVALLFLDLDRFKTINDSLGHSVGDLLLKEVADRLKNWAREQDTVARLGGDEFVAVLTSVKEASDAAVAADRILTAMAPEFQVQGHLLSLSCSLGISVYPDNGKEAETLLKNADAAMYCAKERGRNNFQFFTQQMNIQAVERMTLENSLRTALERNELFLVYQPQVDLATGQVTGAEALLRWRHPELGLIPPDKFIPIAENSGLILPIGEWVLKTACAQARQWQNEGLPLATVGVNVSAVQFRHERFLYVIRKVLEQTGLSASSLELELTEGLLLANAEVTLSMLRELVRMGLKLSIDDFGTGFSSLSYLRQFPVNRLKIDRSFVQSMTEDPDAAVITGTIINMAKSLRLRVIAEGVENQEQLRLLREQNCEEVQGFYFSRPLVAADFSEKMRSISLLRIAEAGTALEVPDDWLAGPSVHDLDPAVHWAGALD
jgi:diguanylate cyclase (GGDEF)-like protein/PAS domain S-box-containing protein